jgi:hypothetical protein
MPATTDPMKKPKVLYPTMMNEKYTPGKIECDNASPINDIFLNTMKHPINPQVMPTMEEVTMARIAYSDERVSRISNLYFFAKIGNFWGIW